MVVCMNLAMSASLSLADIWTFAPPWNRSLTSLSGRRDTKSPPVLMRAWSNHRGFARAFRAPPYRTHRMHRGLGLSAGIYRRTLAVTFATIFVRENDRRKSFGFIIVDFLNVGLNTLSLLKWYYWPKLSLSQNRGSKCL